MAFAGLWEVWRHPDHPDAAPLRTCAIVTTRANELMAPIHDRMPVVLAPPVWAAWLDPATDAAAVERLMAPAPSEWFEAFPVSTLVNKVTNEGPRLLDPLPAPPAGSEAHVAPGVDHRGVAENLETSLFGSLAIEHPEI